MHSAGDRPHASSFYLHCCKLQLLCTCRDVDVHYTKCPSKYYSIDNIVEWRWNTIGLRLCTPVILGGHYNHRAAFCAGKPLDYTITPPCAYLPGKWRVMCLLDSKSGVPGQSQVPPRSLACPVGARRQVQQCLLVLEGKHPPSWCCPWECRVAALSRMQKITFLFVQVAAVLDVHLAFTFPPRSSLAFPACPRSFQTVCPANYLQIHQVLTLLH